MSNHTVGIRLSLYAYLIGLLVVPTLIPGHCYAGRLETRYRSLEDLVDHVQLHRIERNVRGLSGADSIIVDGCTVKLHTRFAYSNEKMIAAQYLVDEISRAGYEPEVQTFVLTTNRRNLMGVAVSRAGDTVWTADAGGDVYRSVRTEGWSKFRKCGGIEGMIFDLESGPEGRLWMAGRREDSGFGILYVSCDGGEIWEDKSFGYTMNAITTIAFDGGQIGLAAGWYGTIIRSADWGENWFQIFSNVINSWSIEGSASNGLMHFWLVSNLGRLFESTNAGFSWDERLFTSTVLNDIDFSGYSCGVIVGMEGVYYTTDGGAVWNETTVHPGPSDQPDLRCVMMADSVRVLAAGADGEIWMSSDGGASWRDIGMECGCSANFCDVELAPGGGFWLAGQEKVVRIDFDWSGDPIFNVYEFPDTVWGKNIIFKHCGSLDEERRVLLCAHYDSRSSPLSHSWECAPGADDNASGTAGVLEMARIFTGTETGITVEFALFDGEEKGLLGSRYFAGSIDDGSVYDAVINMDMLGRDYGGGNIVEIAGRSSECDTVLVKMIMDIVDSLGLDLSPRLLTGRFPASDHHAFWIFDGLPSVLLIEGEYWNNPHYHSCTDAPDYIDFDYLTECTRAVLATAAVMVDCRFTSGDDEPGVRLALLGNNPNPFSSNTRISFVLPQGMRGTLDIYDVSGRRVKSFKLYPGDSGVVWDGRNYSGRMIGSGVYFIRLAAGADVSTGKIVFLR